MPSDRGSLRTYEPRVIRADIAHNPDATCPSTTSVSPSRTRRPSASASGLRAPSVQRSSVSLPGPSSMPSAPFPRPTYLDYSALRHLLHTDDSPLLPQARKVEAMVVRPDPSHAGRRIIRSPSSDSDDEDQSSSREPPSTTSAPLTSSPILRLPTRWCDEFRHSLLSVSSDGRDLTYHGTPSTGDKDPGAARTMHHVPPACGIYYYEVEITSNSKGSKGFIGPNVKVSRLPGWEPNSWGYHGDDGSSFAAETSGTPYGPNFGAGDVIGCGIDFSQNRIFYTKNGALLGMVFENVGKDCELYPAVGLCHSGESIRANFGHEPFKYDIEDHVQQQRDQTWANIQTTPLKWPSAEKDSDGSSALEGETGDASEERMKLPINELVLSYLSHHGYARTARAFQSQCKARGGLPGSESATRAPPSPASSRTALTEDHGMDMDNIPSRPADDIELRTHIVHSVTTGDIDTALSETQTHFPAVLAYDEGLMLFKLRCRKFVELVLEAAEMKKRMKTEECDMNVEPEADGDGLFKSAADEMDVDDEELPVDGMMTNGFGGGSAAIPIKGKRKQSFTSQRSPTGGTASYGSALEKAVAYGQKLQDDYKHRAELRAIFKRTSVIIAFDDPLGAGGDAAEVAGQAARVALATELNQAILRSQGRPAQPALERLYRQSAASLLQLALMGVGAAAFADMPKEFLDA
ncbi:SPRY-domain-containing protein [Leucogyrophana mollusca]|uniref:SPRY-domain-containing protein n=1 Tax=Leucogyrophana mollusca TaxID=85980 RepID=A0ACB8BY45_9AGAM|nr:SPRY-domain-containing protein [Leucogyrophana mollusca]